MSDCPMRLRVRYVAGGALLASALLAGCAGPSPAPPSPPLVPATAVAPLPPLPWRDDVAPITSGSAEWLDAGRDRRIAGRWTAAAGARGFVVILPGLAQGALVPRVLTDELAHAGLVVLVLGHPDNDAALWQGPDARRADVALAARQAYTMSAAAARVADVRYVLEALRRQPPAWLPAAALANLGLLGIGPGAQTAQWLAGEWMLRAEAPATEPGLRAVALVAPYVGFEGPAMRQRYATVTTPLLLAYGLAENDPFGLGMSAQQRRAMAELLVNARLLELRLPSSSAALLQVTAQPAAADAERDLPRRPPTGMARGDAPDRSGRGPAGGAAPPGATAGPPTGMLPPSGREAVPANSRADAAGRTALLFSLVAFFESELLRSVDAREWLEGSHPPPATWATLPAGRRAPPQ